MKKNKITKKSISFFGVLFHKPLLFLFLIILLPFLVWGIQQTQQIISFGKNANLLPQAATNPCPTTSSQSYDTLRVSSDYPKPENPEQNPDINMDLRGYERIDEKLELVNYGGDTDPIMPPSIGTIFAKTPAIVGTYRVYKWDYDKNVRSPELESHWPVNLLGLATNPGEPLVGPKAGRQIGGGNVLMLVYANPSSATFVHGEGENPGDGYFIHMANFCVDPNLLTAYRSANASGRGSLPVIRTGQIFGYGNGSDFRIAIRDSWDWMDPRSRKDWWQESDATSGPRASEIINQPTAAPTSVTQPTNPALPTPTAIILMSTPTTIPVTFNPPTIVPTQIITRIIMPTGTPAPTITPTPTSAPFIDIKKTVESAKSVWVKLFDSFIQFSKVILP